MCQQNIKFRVPCPSESHAASTAFPVEKSVVTTVTVVVYLPPNKKRLMLQVAAVAVMQGVGICERVGICECAYVKEGAGDKGGQKPIVNQLVNSGRGVMHIRRPQQTRVVAPVHFTEGCLYRRRVCVPLNRVRNFVSKRDGEGPPRCCTRNSLRLVDLALRLWVIALWAVESRTIIPKRLIDIPFHSPVILRLAIAAHDTSRIPCCRRARCPVREPARRSILCLRNRGKICYRLTCASSTAERRHCCSGTGCWDNNASFSAGHCRTTGAFKPSMAKT